MSHRTRPFVNSKGPLTSPWRKPARFLWRTKQFCRQNAARLVIESRRVVPAPPRSGDTRHGGSRGGGSNATKLPERRRRPDAGETIFSPAPTIGRSSGRRDARAARCHWPRPVCLPAGAPRRRRCRPARTHPAGRHWNRSSSPPGQTRGRVLEAGPGRHLQACANSLTRRRPVPARVITKRRQKGRDRRGFYARPTRRPGAPWV